MPKSVVNSLHTVSNNWQQQLAESITDPQELLSLLQLSPEDFPDCHLASEDFQLRVTRAFAAKMKPGDRYDPLLLQVMTNSAERNLVAGFHSDPVGDLDAMPVPGLLHKYQGRVLLITTGACAIHCRYCFRRHFPYNDNHPGRNDWQQALDYIRQRNDIHEVILSGGDPLVLSDQKLDKLIQAIAGIPHIKRLRIHSRLPVVLPDRITPEMLNLFSQTRLNVCMVIHANHAREITATEASILEKLHYAGVTLLNQCVLLKDINDSLAAQIDLSETLFRHKVLPYYLHLLDPVQGAAHFHVDANIATHLIQKLQCRLPGYLVPRLVVEIPGECSKIPVNKL